MKRYKIERGFAGRMKMVEAPNGEYVFYSEIENILDSVNATDNQNSQYAARIQSLRIELSSVKQENKDLEDRIQRLNENDGHFETQSKIMARGLDRIAKIHSGEIKGTSVKDVLLEIKLHLKHAGL
ncbi:hypothetical protein phiOC_p195 [Ochrobactrum phage vB_OspM_OC]|nr:hypothetical protein phiOC_p195 [Ochrobactrum phage vB_OspM_OC]